MHPTAPRRVAPFLLLLAAVLLGACGRQESGAGDRGPGAPGNGGPLLGADQDQSQRTWVGLLPCTDCEGVDTRLVLNSRNGQRDYVLTETYLAHGDGQRFSGAGPWSEARALVDGEDTIVYQLDPARSGQRYALQPDGALELLDGNGKTPGDALAYRLQRQ